MGRRRRRGDATTGGASAQSLRVRLELRASSAATAIASRKVARAATRAGARRAAIDDQR